MYQLKNFSKMPRTIGGLLEDIFQNNRMLSDELWNDNQMHVPVNIKETESGYQVSVVAPGIKKEDIKLSIEKNILNISFESKEEKMLENEKMLRSEYKFKSFSRSFTLHDKINTSAIEAKYQDGILEITLPKKELTAPENQIISIA